MFLEKFSLETPEHVAVEFEVAGPMSRFAAALLDGLLLGGALLLLALIALIVGLVAQVNIEGVADPLLALAVLVFALLGLGYFPLLEWIMKGQTPGKRALGLRVMRRDMAPLDFTSIFVRAVLRIVDVLPGLPFPLVGLVSMTVSDQGLRLGDLAAGTWVVRDPGLTPLIDLGSSAPVRIPARRPRTADPAAPLPEGRLTAEEYRIAREFLERAPSLDPEQRRAAALRIAGPVLDRLGERRLDAEVFLREEAARGAAGRSLL